MRAFIGLPCPEAWITPLARAHGRLPGGRQVSLDDLHVTLAFLDDQPEEKIEALHDMLSARTEAAVDLNALAYSAFASGRRSSLAVLDLAGHPNLTTLRDATRRAVRSAGIDLPRDRFRPHITLVRYPASAPADTARLQKALTDLNPPALPPATAQAVTLWCSTLTPGGPVYDPLASYPLRAA